MTLLRERLRPVPTPDAKAVAGWVADLDSDQFKVRDQAQRNLLIASDTAIGALRKVLQGKPSLEVRFRVEKLLTLLDEPPMPALRAFGVLETIGTQEAREFLQGLAKGAPDARTTEAARAALKRMDKVR